MSFTFYDATVRQSKAALSGLTHLIDQAEKHAKSNELLGARLYEDMNPFTFQVHTVTKNGEMVAARVSNREPIEYQDDLKSYDEIRARIASVTKALDEVSKDETNDRADQLKDTQLGPAGSAEVSTKSYFMGAIMPNIAFHVSIAYAILRKEGVPLGKGDYLKPYIAEWLGVQI